MAETGAGQTDGRRLCAPGKLLPKGYTSRSEYDAAQAALRSSQSALAAAQAQLANAREQLGYTALIAEAPG